MGKILSMGMEFVLGIFTNFNFWLLGLLTGRAFLAGGNCQLGIILEDCFYYLYLNFTFDSTFWKGDNDYSGGVGIARLFGRLRIILNCICYF